jgi:hypothetical protein
MSFRYLIGQYASNKPAKVLTRHFVGPDVEAVQRRHLEPYAPIEDGEVLVVWSGAIARQTGKQPAECGR